MLGNTISDGLPPIDDGLDPADGGTAILPGRLWEHDGETPRQLWLDASHGASDAMLLAALLDVGADAMSVARALEIVAPGRLHLQWERVHRRGLSALRADVVASEQEIPDHSLRGLALMLDAAELPEHTRELAMRACRRLAEAEATVHGTDAHDTPLQAAGTLEALGGIVAVCEAFRTLHAERAMSSVVALGDGTVETDDGAQLVPQPVVVEASKGWPVEAGPVPGGGELCTAAGMALIRTLCDDTGPMPPMSVQAMGTGAGEGDRVLRAILSQPAPKQAPVEVETDDATPGAQEVQEVSANVDDFDPRLWPAVLDRLLDAGATDAWLTPIVSRHGRPAHTIATLAPADYVGYVTQALVTHTSTVDVRVSAPMHHRILQRAWLPVEVGGHDVRIKISGDGPGHAIEQATAEFADVETLADELGLPHRVALSQAQTVAWQAGLYPGAPWPEEGVLQDA